MLPQPIHRDQPSGAAERIGQFDASRRFGPWFLRSVVNDAIKAANHRRRYVAWESDPTEDELALAYWLADSSSGPEELAETSETRKAVGQALG